MRNVCCYFILSYIMANKYCHYTSSYINEKYTSMYKRDVCCYYISSYIMINKYFCYTSSHITEIFIVIIHHLV